MSGAAFDPAAASADFISAGQAPIRWPAKVNGRTGQRVRRDSQPEEAAAGFYRPLSPKAAAQLMRAAERLMKAGMFRRAQKRRWGELTPTALQLLEVLLFQAMDWSTGKCDWSYEQIAKASGRCRQTVADGLAALERLGILERMRRFRRIAEGGREPQIEQVTNAYRFKLTDRLKALIGWREPPPVPDDLAHAALERRMALDQYITADTGKPTLGDSLARLGRAVERGL